MSPEEQLAGFIARFTPEIAAPPWDRGRHGRIEIRAVTAKRRPRRPGQPAGA